MRVGGGGERLRRTREERSLWTKPHHARSTRQPRLGCHEMLGAEPQRRVLRTKKHVRLRPQKYEANALRLPPPQRPTLRHAPAATWLAAGARRAFFFFPEFCSASPHKISKLAVWLVRRRGPRIAFEAASRQERATRSCLLRHAFGGLEGRLFAVCADSNLGVLALLARVVAGSRRRRLGALRAA